eukprot:Nitzschia sp. Nitz4//scaffold9_size221794//38404//40413//NITZ4_001325-RA/size221794-snap-gene-0.127-mRNA-1//-1//CDS//3329560938//8459//frame0
MKLSLLALSAVLAGASAGSEDVKSRHVNKAFLAAMNKNPRMFETRKQNRVQNIQELHHRLLGSARRLAGEDEDREEGNQDENQDFDESDLYSDVGTWNGDYWEFNGDLPFDLSQRSLKYTGCSAIKTYDPDNDEDNDAMVTDTYAVFRLCPANSCNHYSVSGCGSDYGEYVIPMQTYMNYLLGFHESRYDDYCQYCRTCGESFEEDSMYYLKTCYQSQTQADYDYTQAAEQSAWEKYFDANNGDMSGWNSEYDGSNYNTDDANRMLEDTGDYYDSDGNLHYIFQESYECANGEACDYCEYQLFVEYGTCDEETCEGSDEFCYDYDYDEEEDEHKSNDENDILDFFECKEIEIHEVGKYYIGPHCGSDHFTVGIGVYSDENCVNYIGDTVSLDYVIQEYDGEDELGNIQLPQVCISCNAMGDDEEEAYNEYENAWDDAYDNGDDADQGDDTYAYGDDANQGDDAYADDYFNDDDLYVLYSDQGLNGPQTDGNGALAMCHALYAASAPCHSKVKDNALAPYMSDYDWELENRYCTFIKNIMSASYDESGEIKVGFSAFDFSSWRNYQQGLRMGSGDAILLSLSIIACVVLGAVAVHTHRSMSRPRSPWRPDRPAKTDGTPMSEEDFLREPSGIGMARTQSGPGTGALI